MSKVCLNVLVGIPGAGKTTFCKRFQEFLVLRGSFLNVINICFDNFIKIDGPFDLENNSFKTKRKRLLELLEQFIQALQICEPLKVEQVNNLFWEEFQQKITVECSKNASDYLILIDDNMYYRSMRYQVFQIARRLGTGYFQTFFNVPLEDAKLRNSQRLNPIPVDVISRMFYKLEKPDQALCWWEKNSVISEDPCEEFDEILNVTMECLKQPVQPQEIQAEKKPVEQSLVHKVDLMLRKAVGEIIKQQKEVCKSSEIKMLSEGLVSKRRLLLEDLREGLVEIDPEFVTVEEMRNLLL